MTSEEILAQYMAQQQAQNRWNSPQNLINLATLGLSGIGGLASGAQQGRQTQLSAEQLAYQQAQDAYMRRLAARQGLQGAILGQLDARQQAGRDMAAASPLGAEQMFASQMARARGLSDVAGNFRPIGPAPGSTITAPSIPNVVGAFATPDYRASISPDATARSIADRRKVLAGLDPNMQFGNMGSFGLPDLGGEVDTYRRGRAADQLSRENQLMQLLNNQMLEASQPLYQTPSSQQPPAQPEKKKGFWSKLGSVLLPAAGIAANFIPGVGPIAGTLLSAGAGAAGGALGGGVKGAILGGAGGAAAGYGINKGQFGKPSGSISGFEGPNLANFGMSPSGQSYESMVMPDLPQFAPPLASRPNALMNPYTSQQSQMQRAITGGPKGQPNPFAGAQWVPHPQTGGKQWIRMIGPDGHTALAEPQNVKMLEQMGWRQAPNGTPFIPATPTPAPMFGPTPVRGTGYQPPNFRLPSFPGGVSSNGSAPPQWVLPG